MTSPRVSNAMAEGTMKKLIRLSPWSKRWRSFSATTSAAPSDFDIAGNSAAETDIPNKLTGSV